MKVLFLTTATGQGHNTAAGAVSESLRARGCETIIGDVLKSGEKDVSGRVSGLYDRMVLHAPHFFGMLYGLGGLVSSSRVHSPIYYLNTLYSASFQRKLAEIAPDVIVCTHIFSAQALTYLREKGRGRVPALAIMTDYTCSPFWEETRLDRYIVPSPLLTDEFVRKGVPAEKIVPDGIPVAARFARKTDRMQARRQLGLPPDRTVFLLMGGSMGYGGMQRICGDLLRQMPEALVAAVCGRNKKLYARLHGVQNVRAYTYIDSVDLLMDAADVLLTKPGGLSSTEAAVKRMPTVFTSPIPGGETCTAEFFSSLGLADFARKPSEAARAACVLASDPGRRDAMRRAQETYIPVDAAVRIADEIFALGYSDRGKKEKGCSAGGMAGCGSA